MIETLNLYSMIEYTDQKDGDLGPWLLSGTMIRLALQQGYHRDPSEHSNLTVFQSEMRRRVWSAVSQHDLLFSVLVGFLFYFQLYQSKNVLAQLLLEEMPF